MSTLEVIASISVTSVLLAILFRLIYVERKNAKNEVSILNVEKEREMERKYRESLEKEVERAEKLLDSRMQSLKELAPDDPRWNDLVFKSASKGLDVYTDPTITSIDDMSYEVTHISTPIKKKK